MVQAWSLFLLGLATTAHAQGAQAEATAQLHVPQVRPEVVIARATGPISVDGVLDEAAWQGAATAASFTEVEPTENGRPLVATEVLLTYDDAHLYVAFRAFDDPKAVRATLSKRDEIFQDDWVGVLLDPFGDAGRVYEVLANPLGVQADLLRTGDDEDVGFDMLFKSAGRLTDDGYAVELAIPFASMRFPQRDVQRWRVTFMRNHPRASRHVYSWAAIERDNPCLPCQFGTLLGIEQVQDGRTLELLPSVVGYQSGALADFAAPRAGLDHDRLQLEPSLGVRYSLSSSATAEATLNPDFSQVESDAAQIDVNSPFALYYPERRPFFQEGSDLFSTFLNVVYTRSVNAPVAAAKLTSRRGATSIAYLGAVDERTPVLIPLEERSVLLGGGDERLRSVSNLLRVRHSFRQNSYAGVLVSDRRYASGGSGTNLAADVLYRFAKHFRAEGQVVLSHTDEGVDSSIVSSQRFDGDRRTASFDGERFWGWGGFASLNRSTKLLYSDLDYTVYNPTFRTPNGFITRSNYHSLVFYQGVNLYPKWAFVDGFFPGLTLGRRYNFDAVRKLDFANLRARLLMKGQTTLTGNLRFLSERYREVDFDGYRDWNVSLSSNFSEPVRVSLYYGGGETIYRIARPVLGRIRSLSLAAALKPSQQFVVEPSFDYERLSDEATREAFYDAYIGRSRFTFQFTRELALRLVLQFTRFDFGGGEREEQLDVEPLLTYQLNSYSIFYLGSTHDYYQFDEPYGLRPTQRQIFFKFQYLIRR